MNIEISILIVNYNTADLVKKCIESVLCQREVRFEIIVVDNASQDMSVSLLQSYIPQIQLIANQDNKGFGAANNQAFHISKGRYIFMLNPDALLKSEYDLWHALQYMDANLQVGLAGTRIVNIKQEVEETVFYYYPRQKQTQMNFSFLPGKIATVLGASMIARRDIFESAGGFDEDFFYMLKKRIYVCVYVKKGVKSVIAHRLLCSILGVRVKKEIRRRKLFVRRKPANYYFIENIIAIKMCANLLSMIYGRRNGNWSS